MTRPITVELDGTTYTARKWTVALRTRLGDAVDTRRQIRDERLHKNLQIGGMQRLESAGTAPDVEAFFELMTEVRDLSDQLEESAYALAPKLFTDGDGKSPTKTLLEEHADPDELAQAVAYALREETPDDDPAAGEPGPTTASADAS